MHKDNINNKNIDKLTSITVKFINIGIRRIVQNKKTFDI